MKVFTSSLFVAATQQAHAAFHPHQISYHELVDEASFNQGAQETLVEALTQVGMIAVTNVDGLNKHAVLGSLQPCAKKSALTKEQVLNDGTRRLTLATHSVPNGQQSMQHEHTDCESFDAVSEAFREKTAEVTHSFGKRLASILSLDSNEPLLRTQAGFAFDKIDDVIESGHHLEHFAAYQQDEATVKEGESKTIDLHTDQGLFIVFTPAHWVKGSSTLETTGGFWIQLPDGTQTEVQFSPEDDLVIMLGDGINQIVNPRLESKLRVTPHSVKIPSNEQADARTWYGRMVLPPFSAVHPQQGKTFEELRSLMVDEENEDSPSALGCSPSAAARQLETTECEEGTTLCWHRCMSHEEAGVSEAICADKGLDLKCINPRLQLWNEKHGDFYPGCVDAANSIVATEYPPLPSFPRDEDICTLEEFDDFVLEGDIVYENRIELESKGGHGDDASKTLFLWNVVENRVQGKLAFNGIYGYISIGFFKPGGAKDGMHGAPCIFATPGGEYSAFSGLNMDIGLTIAEYIIPEDGKKASFRHWANDTFDVEAVADSRSVGTPSQVQANDCFTSLTFDTSSIAGQSFQVESEDSLIWAVNDKDTFCGYHDHRGNFTINWNTSEWSINEPLRAVVEAESGVESMAGVLAVLGGFIW